MEYREFAGRTHRIVSQDGWEEVAEYALTWAVEHAVSESTATTDGLTTDGRRGRRGLRPRAFAVSAHAWARLDTGRGREEARNEASVAQPLKEGGR